MDGVHNLEEILTVENLIEWNRNSYRELIDVYLPRLKMRFSLKLNDVLISMGMEVPFDDKAADFSGMDGNPDWIYIDEILHKAFVDVNEEGTETAAATGVVMRLTAVPTPPPVFRADHPFIFMIKDNSSGSILFMGRVSNPAKQGK